MSHAASSPPWKFPGLFAAIAAALLGPITVAIAAPAIRTGPSNPVPACVTPERLMAFLTERNPSLDPRFAGIATYYKQWGDAWRVRWDYAFFQMAIETNYLKYRRGDGRRGDVNPSQNNFAGIGATGGGVPGDRFADVSSGVHAQIQHLVAYSGERLAKPIAPRTALKQEDIVSESQALNRPVTFGDLARRWAVDRQYARSIDFVAGTYRDKFCRDGEAASNAITPPAPQPARRREFLPPSGLGGPKPSALAGPETEEPASGDAEVLPWATAPAVAPTPAAAVPPPQPKPAKKTQAKAKSPSNSPARTIWARGDTPSSPAPATPARLTTAATAAPAPLASPAVVSEDANVFSLPLFRIAPYKPEPSRLGGPAALDPRPVTPAASSDTPAEPACRVLTATYGGSKTLLVRSTLDGEMRLTALTVLDGFEKTMFETYARASAPGAEIVGEYETQAAAIADARENCPEQ